MLRGPATARLRGLRGLLLLSGFAVLAGAAPPAGEYRVKAVFLFNFARFVDWPAIAHTGSTDPFSLCIYGEDPFGADLDEVVRGETIHGRPLAVRRIREVEALAGCQVVFIAGSANGDLESVVAALGHRATLTVSDVAGAARRGAMIRMMTVGGKVRLRINLDAVRAAHLTLSSNLLRAAELVGSGSTGDDS